MKTEWKIQDLGERLGYPNWHAYAIRDAKTNVHIATVGSVDRYFEDNTKEHAELIVKSPLMLQTLQAIVALLDGRQPKDPAGALMAAQSTLKAIDRQEERVAA